MVRGKATKNMFKEYEKQIKEFQDSVIKIGLPAKVANKQHSDGVTLLLVGAVHEYGVPEKNIPKRSFLREPMFKAQKRIKKMIFKEFDKVAGNTKTAKQALNLLGAFGQGISQSSFRDNDWEQLKYRDGTPLIDTGQLRGSITYIVEKK